MKPLPTPRTIPPGDRYWSVTVTGDLAECHFRLPSFNRSSRLLKHLTSFREGDGIDRLIGLLDVAGYAIGECWFHQAYDLTSGAPALDLGERGDWHGYGDRVVDEMQELGVTYSEILAIVNGIIERIGRQLSEIKEAQDLAGE